MRDSSHVDIRKSLESKQKWINEIQGMLAEVRMGIDKERDARRAMEMKGYEVAIKGIVSILILYTRAALRCHELRNTCSSHPVCSRSLKRSSSSTPLIVNNR